MWRRALEFEVCSYLEGPGPDESLTGYCQLIIAMRTSCSGTVSSKGRKVLVWAARRESRNRNVIGMPASKLYSIREVVQKEHHKKHHHSEHF